MDVRRMGWQGVEKSGGCSVPQGLIVEARLNGAGAGKVSAQRGQQRRKYYSCMEGRYLTPHSTLCSEKREVEEEPREQRDRNATQPKMLGGGDGAETETDEGETCRE